MTRIQCNSCGATWLKPKPQDYVLPHVCPDTLIDQHAQCDPVTGKTVKEATYKPVVNPRNENFKPHPDNPRDYVMISEGSGVTEIN